MFYQLELFEERAVNTDFKSCMLSETQNVEENMIRNK